MPIVFVFSFWVFAGLMNEKNVNSRSVSVRFLTHRSSIQIPLDFPRRQIGFTLE
jgi:hypothetical protein